MDTYKIFAKGIVHFYLESEIVNYINSDSEISDIWNNLDTDDPAAVIPLVALKSVDMQTYNLHILVKRQRKTKFGQFDYFLVLDFVDSEINLYKLLEKVCVLTHADLHNILSTITIQLQEIGSRFNQEFSVVTDQIKKRLFYVRRPLEFGAN